MIFSFIFLSIFIFYFRFYLRLNVFIIKLAFTYALSFEFWHAGPSFINITRCGDYKVKWFRLVEDVRVFRMAFNSWSTWNLKKNKVYRLSFVTLMTCWKNIWVFTYQSSLFFAGMKKCRKFGKIRVKWFTKRSSQNLSDTRTFPCQYIDALCKSMYFSLWHIFNMQFNNYSPIIMLVPSK